MDILETLSIGFVIGFVAFIVMAVHSMVKKPKPDSQEENYSEKNIEPKIQEEEIKKSTSRAQKKITITMHIGIKIP